MADMTDAQRFALYDNTLNFMKNFFIKWHAMPTMDEMASFYHVCHNAIMCRMRTMVKNGLLLKNGRRYMFVNTIVELKKCH